MIGFIVKHNGFGLGKITEQQNEQIRVHFFSPPQQFTIVPLDGRYPLKRALLPINSICAAPGGKCHIANAGVVVSGSEPYSYQVKYENGLDAEVSEVDMIPILIPRIDSPLEAVAELQIEGYETCQKREALAEVLWSAERGTSGLRALLSSRIDLRPHQAYVAGTVLLDRLPRYILADEVGLGKTIEAGIVIHDLLERKPAAKVLILCPSTLTQQWLCEMFAKFCGQVFHMVELRPRAASAGIIPDKAIASFPAAIRHYAILQHTKWDLVVVDEAHHLLGVPRLYSLAQKLSAAAPGCLLLSAIPAQHREEEYLRLLALLEPQRYHPGDPKEQENFKELYSRQIELGRKLSYISRRLADYLKGDESADAILIKIGELAALPVLSHDGALAALAKTLNPKETCFAEKVHAILYHIGDRYRISRRILRNRRSQLTEVEPDLHIARRLNRLSYNPLQPEVDALNAVRRLLQELRSAKVSDSILLPLARQLFQSLCDPECLCLFVDLAKTEETVLEDLLEFDGHVGYQGWEEFSTTLWEAVGARLPKGALQDLRSAAAAWKAEQECPARIQSLVNFLTERHRQNHAHKFIVFAGFYGLAHRLARSLAEEFKRTSVAEFSWELDSKEKEVTRFRRDSQCWLMVSDETGGEGRNFQFVDELIHFDLPWHVSKIEQRIGRLDRLGRKHPEVCSNVLIAAGQEDDGFLCCLQQGFQIFERSISGLEFTLSQLEGRILKVAMDDGFEGLVAQVDHIKKLSEAERAGDENQGMLDAASLERKSAEVFRRAQSTPERDLALEKAFCDYFHYIGGNGVMRFVPAGNYPEGVVEFRPDQVKDVKLPLPAQKNGGQPDRLGTFRRQIAQERPDLDFFTVGNEFFDAVCSTLRTTSKGRKYAVELLSPKSAQWVGFEFSYRLVGRRELLAGHPGLVKHLDRVLAVRGEHCFIAENLKPAPDQKGLLDLRRAIKKEDKNVSWWNFTLNNTRVQLLSDRYAKSGWDALVKRAEALAKSQARERFAQILSPILESEQSRVQEQIRQAKAARSDGWEDEVAGYEALIQAIVDWDLELDLVGFLSINGGIIA